MGSACTTSKRRDVLEPSDRADQNKELFKRNKIKFSEEREVDTSTMNKSILAVDFGAEGEDQEAVFEEYSTNMRTGVVKNDPLKKIRQEQEAYDQLEREMRLAIPNKEKVEEISEESDKKSKDDFYVENFNRWNAVELNGKKLAGQRAKFDNSKFKKAKPQEETSKKEPERTLNTSSTATTSVNTVNNSIAFERDAVSKSLNTSLWGEDPLGNSNLGQRGAIIEVHDSRQDTVDEIDKLLKDL